MKTSIAFPLMFIVFFSTTSFSQDLNCGAMIRMSFQEKIFEQNNEDHKFYLKHDFCIAESEQTFQSESEVQDAGFGMENLYGSIFGSSKSQHNFESLRNWAKKECSKLLTTQALEKREQLLKTTLNVPAIRIAYEKMIECQKLQVKDMFGLHCDAWSDDGKHLTIFARYIPPEIGGTPATVISSSTNALSMNNNAPASEVFSSNTKIPPRGIMASFVRENPSDSIKFNIVSDKQSCSPTVKGAPKYSLAGRIFGDAFVTETTAIDFNGIGYHSNCKNTSFIAPSEGCIDSKFKINSVVLSKNTENPHTKTLNNNCFKAFKLEDKSIIDTPTKTCYKANVRIGECKPSGLVIGSCGYAQKDRTGCSYARCNGTKFTVTATGTRTTKKALEEWRFERENATGTSTTIRYDLPMESTMSDAKFRFEVIVVNLNTGSIQFLSSSNSEENGFSATFDTQNKKLTILMPDS